MAEREGIVHIHGREYQTVALRVSRFREAHPDYSLLTEILSIDDSVVLMKAEIADPTGRVLATGHAEERRSASTINRTSALENAETSAIGRALAALGLGGSEFATANEVQGAIAQQEERTAENLARLVAAMEQDCWSVAAVMAHFGQDEQQELFKGTVHLSSKQKTLVRSMQQEAVVKAHKIKDYIQAGMDENDPAKTIEAWEELSDSGKTVVWQMLDGPQKKAVKDARDALAP